MSQVLWKHRTMSTQERKNFIGLYEDIKSKHNLFKFIKFSNETMTLWLMFILCLYSLSCYHVFYDHQTSIWKCICVFILGMICLQVIFVASHTEAHALFLEYEAHYPNSQRVQKLPIYFYAFYHHHHMEKDNTDDWATELSYHDKANDMESWHIGTRNVVAAHWHGYTFFHNFGLIIVLVIMIKIMPISVFYFFGYEVGVLLLPFAHAWQHINHKRMPLLVPIFKTLEYLGIIANKDDHVTHHQHDTATVYQDFCSSGIRMVNIDWYVNRFWNCAFYEAHRKGVKPYDIISPYRTGINVLMIFVVPIVLHFVL